MNLRIVRDVLVLAVVALLPPVIAGCAAAKGGEPGLSPHYAPTTTGAAPAARARVGASGMSHLVPPQSMPAPGEELWVIQKHPETRPADDGQTPGTGAVVVPRGDALVPIPLKHTDVKASVVGHVGTVRTLTLRQSTVRGIAGQRAVPGPGLGSQTGGMFRSSQIGH